MAAMSCERPTPLVYQRVIPPPAMPVSIERARRHLRLDEVDLDDMETDLLTAATSAATEHLDGRAGTLGRALITQTWTALTNRPAWNVDGPVSGFMLEFGPVQAVTRVEYLSAGAYQLMPPAAWRAVPRSGNRTAILAVGGAAWPSADPDPEAWRITFRAGYGDTGEAVPAPIRAAMLLMIADLYDHREGKVQANLVENPTVERLLAPYRRVGV